MTYTDFNTLVSDIDRVLADSKTFYGDFGFDFRIEWDENTVQNIEVTWPRLTSSYVDDTYRFAEALSALCYELRPFVGDDVEE